MPLQNHTTRPTSYRKSD